MDDDAVTAVEIATLWRMCREGSPAPWLAMVEGRDFTSGDSFIMVGWEDDRGEDMYVTRDAGPADAADLDLIATARTYLPRLLREIERWRGSAAAPGGGG